MYKIDLNAFTVKNGEKVFGASVPMSLFSVLNENGEIENPYYRDKVHDRFAAMTEPVEISASFTLSSDASKLRYAYLEIPDLDTAAQIVFNGGKSEFSVSAGREHRLDVSDATVSGENTVLVRIPRSSEPRDITLFEGIKFIAFARSHITDVSAKPVFVSNSVSVDIAMEFLGDSRDVKAVATLVSPSGKLYYGGINNGRALINIPDPLLWWPGQYGVQNLYKLSINLYQENEIVDSRELRVGLRSVFRDERAHSGFTVNGVPFFALGIEYVMDGYAPAFTASSGAAALVGCASDANANFIRYRGEGRYPCDAFLDLCDAKGIAVEFVIKSDKLERGEENSFRRELAYNLKRLSRHPSVISVAYEASHLSDRYEAIISEVRSGALSSILVREITENDTFRTPPSVPDMKTLESFMLPEDMNLFSYVMEKHMASPTTAVEMLSLAAEEYKYASTMNDLIYISGVLQAHRAEQFVRGARRLRSELGCAVIGTLADSKPSVSSSVTDFAYRPKPVRYLASRFYSPLLVFAEPREEGVGIIVSNESRTPFSGAVEYTLRDNRNKSIHTARVDVSVDKLSACEISAPEIAELVLGRERECYIDIKLVGERSELASSVYLFVPQKHFKFIDPTIVSAISGSGREYFLTYTGSAFAKDIVFSFGSHDAVFEDNCVDLTKDAPSRIRFTTSVETTKEALEADLCVRCMFDIGRGV